MSKGLDFPPDYLIPSVPKISHDAFIGAVWGGFSIASIFIGCRFYLRYRKFGRFYIDDAFVLLAWTMALADAIFWEIASPRVYYSNEMLRGIALPLPDTVSKVKAYMRGFVADGVMFFSILWCIKLSFLFFFRRLYVSVGRWMRYWWAIFGVLIASWVFCIASMDFPCYLDYELAVKECPTIRRWNHQKKMYIAACVLDVGTDMLVTSIPITMLWKVRISMRRKLGLIGLFSLTGVIIAFAITRVSLVSSSKFQYDVLWLYNWGNMEIYIALIVSSLGSFRSLFKSQDSTRKHASPQEGDVATFGSPPRRRIHSFSYLYRNSVSRPERTFQTTDGRPEVSEVELGFATHVRELARSDSESASSFEEQMMKTVGVSKRDMDPTTGG